MEIKILGPGCTRCHALERVTRDALDELGLTAEVEEVTDVAEIAAWGVMATPALVVDDRVVLAGRVPAVDQVKALLAG
jgi:small redox-active disulfide protein 2